MTLRLAAVVLAALASVAEAAHAADPPTPEGSSPRQYQTFWLGSPVFEQNWADRGTAAGGDLDGDGVEDVFVKGTNPYFCPAVYALSGRPLGRGERAVIYTTQGPNCQSLDTMSALGDVSGDGVPDLVVGAGANRIAFVFSGKTGALLHTLNDPTSTTAQRTGTRFGARVGRAGDLTGDGRPEVLVGAPGTNIPVGCGFATPTCQRGAGRAFIFNGATGGLLRPLDIPVEDLGPPPCGPSACPSFGNSVQGPGDVDGDGVPDQLVGANAYPPRNTGRMYLFSGATGAPLRKIDSPAPQQTVGEGFGFQEAAPLSPGDVNRDGFADLYGATIAGTTSPRDPAAEPAPPYEGRAWVFDGRSVTSGPPATPFNTPLYELNDPTPGASGNFGWSMSRTDYDNDGTPDLYVGQAPHGAAGPEGTNGGTYVFNGRDGSLMKALEVPEAHRQGPNGALLGWFSTAPGDLNGDRLPDYVAGAPGSVRRLYVFVSLIRSAGPGAGAGAGTRLSLVGCPPARAARHLISLSSATETRNGTPGADLFFAGAGDDVIDGLGGDDCIDLGAGADRGQGGLGDDFIVGRTGADLISGSSGRDRLRGEEGNDRLNGGSGADRLTGGKGADLLNGAFGSDSLFGESGADRISGSRGRDRLSGGAGNDRLSGGSVADRVAGGSGSDRISGNSSNDLLRGHSGADRLSGGSGLDRIAGGSGDDRITARDGQRDRVSCGSGSDRVVADRGDSVAADCERVRRVDG